MQPTLHEGDLVVGWRRKPRVGSIVVAKYGGREVIKRVEQIVDDAYYVTGDNRDESTDSRHYGKISESIILGTIMIILPKATNPPKLVKPEGVLLGRIAASVLIVMALVHLFRIDTLIPILDSALPGGNGMATTAALFVVLSEIFAIPFALRMRLSLLAHIISGALLAFAPLWWVLMSVWALGLSANVGELGEFYAVPGSLFVVVLNIVWVAFNYLTLYLLGYNRLSMRMSRKR